MKHGLPRRKKKALKKQHARMHRDGLIRLEFPTITKVVKRKYVTQAKRKLKQTKS